MEWLDELNRMMKPLAEGQYDAPIAMGSAGLGIWGLISNALEANRRQKAQRSMQNLAMSPLDISAFYRPATDIENRVQRNAVAAEYAARGLGDSSAGSIGIGESLAKTERERYNSAVQQAIAARQASLNGMSGSASLNPGAMNWGDPFKALADYQKAQQTKKINDAWLARTREAEIRSAGQGAGQAYNFGNFGGYGRGDTSFYPAQAPPEKYGPNDTYGMGNY